MSKTLAPGESIVQAQKSSSPFGEHLRADNRWVRLSEVIPWALIEEKYRESMSSPTRGQKACSSRVAFGAMNIKEQIGLTDEDTVLRIQENPYLQYFLGFPEYRMDPHGPTRGRLWATLLEPRCYRMPLSWEAAGIL